MKKFFECVLCVLLIIFWPITGWGLYMKYKAKSSVARYFRRLAIYGLVAVLVFAISIEISKFISILVVLFYAWNGIRFFALWGDVRKVIRC